MPSNPYKPIILSSDTVPTILSSTKMVLNEEWPCCISTQCLAGLIGAEVASNQIATVKVHQTGAYNCWAVIVDSIDSRVMLIARGITISHSVLVDTSAIVYFHYVLSL